MRRGLMVAFAVVGITACGQESDSGTADVSAAGSAQVSPYIQTCLEMVTQQNWSEATRLCSLASNADPSNADVKAALATAKAALAGAPEASDAVSLESAEAAGEAADEAAEAAEKAKDAMPH